MSDFEKPVSTEETVVEGENIPTPEEIAELEAATNELAQEATSLTEELSAAVDNPETTEEQLGYFEAKVCELKELLNKNNIYADLILPAAAVTGAGLAAFAYDPALSDQTKTFLFGYMGAMTVGLAVSIGDLLSKIKKAKDIINTRQN